MKRNHQVHEVTEETDLVTPDTTYPGIGNVTNDQDFSLTASKDDLLQYPDFQSSDAVSLSDGSNDHIVTVTIQQAGGDPTDSLNLPSSLLETSADHSPQCLSPLTSDDTISLGSSGNANVVVLSQPHEIAAVTPGFHVHPGDQEPVFNSDLLDNDDSPDIGDTELSVGSTW